MATRFHKINGTLGLDGFLIREKDLFGGKLLVEVVDPQLKSIGDVYACDDKHEFQQAARTLLESHWIGQVLYSTEGLTVGDRVDRDTERRLQLQELLHQYKNQAVLTSYTIEKIELLYGRTKVPA